MGVEQLTYIEIATRLNVSREAARAIVKRHRLQRTRSNDGKTLVAIDLEEIQHKPLSTRSPRGDPAVTQAVALLQTKVTMLEAELEAERGRSMGHRGDFEQERARCDQLMSELLTTTANLMAAREVTSRLEGENVILRSRKTPKPQPKHPWLHFWLGRSA